MCPRTWKLRIVVIPTHSEACISKNSENILNSPFFHHLMSGYRKLHESRKKTCLRLDIQKYKYSYCSYK